MRPLLSFIYRHLKFFEELLNSLSVALLLLTAMYCWTNLPLNFIMEETLTKATVKITDFFNGREVRPYGMKDVMFIDVSRSSAIVNDQLGTHVMADREKLDTLFQLLHKHTNPDQIIVCDLYFDVTSEKDWQLQSSMAKFPNLLSTVKTDWFGDITPNVLRAGTSGTTGFKPLHTPFMIFSNSMFKFHYTDDHCVKTIPVLMYERLNNLHAACLGDALKMGDDWFFNTILINEELGHDIPKAVYEDQVLPIQAVINDVKAKKNDLAAMMQSKKFIMIGDYEANLQHTTFGDKPRTMILFDLFLSLQQKENMISAGWLVMTLTFLTLLIYNRFYHFNFLRKYSLWLDEHTTVLGFKALPAIDWLLFYILILCSGIFFHVYMEAIAGLLFLGFIAWVRIYAKARYVKFLQFKRSGRRWGARALFAFVFTKPGFNSEKAL